MELVDFKGVPLPHQAIDEWVKVPRFIGNIRTDYGIFANFMNVIDIPLAAPFVAGSIVNQLPPGLLQIFENTRKSAERSAEQSKQEAQ